MISAFDVTTMLVTTDRTWMSRLESTAWVFMPLNCKDGAQAHGLSTLRASLQCRFAALDWLPQSGAWSYNLGQFGSLPEFDRNLLVQSSVVLHNYLHQFCCGTSAVVRDLHMHLSKKVQMARKKAEQASLTMLPSALQTCDCIRVQRDIFRSSGRVAVRKGAYMQMLVVHHHVKVPALQPQGSSSNLVMRMGIILSPAAMSPTTIFAAGDVGGT